MKNATDYQKKIKKLLSGASRKVASPKVDDPFAFLIEAILQADAPRKQARAVMDAINKEFVDYNELRVAPVKDIVDCMGRDFWCAREKSESIITVLNGIFDHSSSLSMEYMEKMPKKDLRKHLQELGATPYAAAVATMVLFGGHAVPVDLSLMYCLEADEYIHPGTDLADVQGFLERIIPQKDDLAAHELFREYVEKNAKLLAKKRKDLIAAAAELAAKVAAKTVRTAPVAVTRGSAPMEPDLGDLPEFDEDEDAPVDIDAEVEVEVLDDLAEPAPPAGPAKGGKSGKGHKPSGSKSDKSRKK